MSKRTYQTKVPDDLIPFCQQMGRLFGGVERALYKDLLRGRNRTQLKKEYQIKYGINARQFNSIYFSIKGKIESRKQCHARHLKQIKERIIDLEKSIKKLEKRIDLTLTDKRIKLVGFSCPIQGKKSSPRQSLKLAIHQKKIKLERLKQKQKRLINKFPSLIFGGKKLWKAQFNLSENNYKDHDQWKEDWKEARSSNILFVGSSDEKSGNQICQLNSSGELKIRVPRPLEPIFGKYVFSSGLSFAYGKFEIEYALMMGNAITIRLAQKNNQWYLFCTVDVPDTHIITSQKNGAMGIDLNPNMIGWAICDGEGNLVKKRSNKNKYSIKKSSANRGNIIRCSERFNFNCRGLFSSDCGRKFRF